MSQETERYQLENNGNTYLGRAKPSGSGADVEANPEGTATADLTKLKVDDTIYGIPEGTEVVANPTLAGTESALTGLQVGDTKYAVPTPHTMNTYTAGTLSEADQAKIAVDIANNYPIKIGLYVYNLFAGAETNIVTFVTILTGYFNEGLQSNDYYIATYNKTTHNLSIQNQGNNHYYIPIHSLLFNFGDTSGTTTTKMIANGQSRVFGAVSTYAQTTAPTADNTDGGIRIVVLSSEPATRYNGYLYIITA